MPPCYLTDDEIAGLCQGLVQNAARVRFLQAMGLPVRRRPDGSPLVLRVDLERLNQPQAQPAGSRRPRWSQPA